MIFIRIVLVTNSSEVCGCVCIFLGGPTAGVLDIKLALWRDFWTFLSSEYCVMRLILKEMLNNLKQNYV